MRKKKPTLRNIVILGKFSDDKVRQIICTEQQQIAVIHTMRALRPDGIIQVLDEPMQIEWGDTVDLAKKIK